MHSGLGMTILQAVDGLAGQAQVIGQHLPGPSADC